jgi:hypothetical protein
MPQEFQQRELTRRAQSDREPHQRPPNYGAGHWVRTVGLLIPLIIAEAVPDPAKKFRYMRIATVSLAIISEGMYAHKVHKQMEQWENQRGR